MYLILLLLLSATVLFADDDALKDIEPKTKFTRSRPLDLLLISRSPSPDEEKPQKMTDEEAIEFDLIFASNFRPIGDEGSSSPEISFAPQSYELSDPSSEDEPLFSLGRSISEPPKLGMSLSRAEQTRGSSCTPVLVPANKQPTNPLANRLTILNLTDETTKRYWKGEHLEPPPKKMERFVEPPSLNEVST